MKKKKRFFHWKKQGLSIALAVLMSSIHLMPANLELVKADVSEVENSEDQQKKDILLEEWNQIAEKLGIRDRISSEDDFEQSKFFETVHQKLDYVENQLDTHQNAMEQLKDLLGIISSSSLESQLEEIVTGVRRTLIHLQDVKNEVERQLEGNYEVDTEGMSQLEAIFEKIYRLKMYGDNLKIFHDIIQGILEMEPATTNEEVYQGLSNLKAQVEEYGDFLDRTEQLIHPNGVNGSSSLITGEQTRAELNQVYAKIEEMLQQQELFHLKELLELNTDGTIPEIYDKISSMKDTMSEYWAYLSQVEEIIQMEDGNHLADGSSIVTGSAVTVRLTGIYDKLVDMVKQQDKMTETIEDLLDRENIVTDTVRELKELLKEMEEQKQQAEQFLKELKSLLDLKDDAGYQDVIDSISNMKNRFECYVERIEDFIKQLGMTSEEGAQEELSAQLKDILKQVWGMMNQLTEEIRKSEETEKKAALLEQKNEELIAENQQAALENKQLKKENEEWKKNLSSHTPNDSNTEELERKNQQQQERIVELERKSQTQQERIAELEKNLLSQSEEVERLTVEREHLLELLSSKDRQIEELKGQIGFLTAQLAEKECKIVELEQVLEKQRPIWELLEKNEVDEAQLIWMLHQKEEKQNVSATEKETIVIQENLSSEEIIVQETRENLETIHAEAETERSETVVPEFEESSSFEREEETTAIATETVETTVQEEESQEKTKFHRLIVIFVLLLILVLSGAMILFFKSRKNTKK